MYPLTVDLLQRVGAMIPSARDYFRATKKWYADSQLAFRAVRSLVARSSAGAKVDVLVNGTQIAGGAISVHTQSKMLNWTADSRLLKAGRNHFAVTVDGQSEARLFLKFACAVQERGIGTHNLDLTTYQPERTPRFAIGDAGEAQFDGDAWRVPPGGHLSFQLDLEIPAPVAFSLAVLHEESNLGKVLKEIWKKVQETRKQLEEQRSDVARKDPSLAEQLDAKISDLTVYLRLHSSQIEPAFLVGDDGTLAEIIARVGNPDRMIEEMQPPVKLTPAQPASVIPLAKAVPPARNIPTIPPVRRPMPPARRGPNPTAPGATAAVAPVTGGLGIGPSILLLLAGTVLIFSGLGYAGWSLIKPMPIVFESPVEGQTVAPNAPLQIWLSANDLAGVKSLTLTTQATDGATVTAPAEPQKYEFPAGTMKTTSKVFTLQLGALTSVEGTIALTATMVNNQGKTETMRRVVKVGGTESDLSFELNPIEPKPGQTVNVAIRMVNAKPGAVINCRVVGTDPYRATHRLIVPEDGVVRFTVPGAAAGIMDVIDAEIEGTNIHRRVSYRF